MALVGTALVGMAFVCMAFVYMALMPLNHRHNVKRIKDIYIKSKYTAQLTSKCNVLLSQAGSVADHLVYSDR